MHLKEKVGSLGCSMRRELTDVLIVSLLALVQPAEKAANACERRAQVSHFTSRARLVRVADTWNASQLSSSPGIFLTLLSALSLPSSRWRHYFATFRLDSLQNNPAPSHDVFNDKTKTWKRCPFVLTSNLSLLLQFGQISVLLLPGKRTFHNLDKKFLEKRRIALDTYLQVSFGEISHSVECAYYLRNQPKVITLNSFLWCWWYFHSWGRFQCNKGPPPVSLSFVFCVTSWRWPISVMSCSNLRATL